MSFFNDFADRLFKKETPPEFFESFYKRLDVDKYLSMMSWYIDPSDLLRKIGGRENLEKLTKVDEIYACIDKRKAALVNTQLVISGGTNEKTFQDILYPFEYQLKQDFFETVLYGYGVEQIIYNENGSQEVVGFQREEFWRFEPQRDLIHVELQTTSDQVWRNQLMPYGKWVLSTNNGTYFNPRGDAVLEKVIQPWLFRCTGWELWMDFAKRFANGFLHGKIEDGSKANEFKKKLEQTGKSSIIVTDKNTELNILQASRDSSLYSIIDDKTVAAFQKVILGETLTSQMAQRGSSGATEVHQEVKWEKTMADLRLVEKSFNETIAQIAYVFRIEGELPVASLMIDPGYNQELATRDQTLASTNQLRFTKKYWVNNYGFDEDEIEVVEPAANPFSKFSSQNKTMSLKPSDVAEYLQTDKMCKSCNTSKKGLKFEARPRKDRRQTDERDEAVEFLIRNGQSPIRFEDLSSAILSAQSNKDLEANMLALFHQDSPEFIDLLTDTFYYAGTKAALLGNPEKLDPKNLALESEEELFVDDKNQVWIKDANGLRKAKET